MPGVPRRSSRRGPGRRDFRDGIECCRRYRVRLSPCRLFPALACEPQALLVPAAPGLRASCRGTDAAHPGTAPPRLRTGGWDSPLELSRGIWGCIRVPWELHQDRETRSGMGQAAVTEEHPRTQGCSRGLGDSGDTVAEPRGLCQCGTAGWPQGPGTWCAVMHS